MAKSKELRLSRSLAETKSRYFLLIGLLDKMVATIHSQSISFQT